MSQGNTDKLGKEQDAFLRRLEKENREKSLRILFGQEFERATLLAGREFSYRSNKTLPGVFPWTRRSLAAEAINVFKQAIGNS